MEGSIPTAAAIDVAVRHLFISYASFGDISNIERLGSAKFSKLTRDAGLLGPRLTATDCDLIFVRAASAAPTRRPTAVTRATPRAVGQP